MSDNNRNFDVSSTVYFIFCILYVALMVIVAVIALIVAAVMVHKASKWF